MAGASLLMLLDDIAASLDDIAAMTKVAAQKTAGVVGDDLALNAQQVNGIAAARELPVVWGVAKGSAKNKLILIPAALAASALAPWAVMPALMVGGAYLCYEGTEKVIEAIEERLHGHPSPEHGITETERHPGADFPKDKNGAPDMAAFEKDKIAGAVRTDFILSGEIIIIALGSVAAAPFITQLGTLAAVGTAMTVGVYGLVAGIVKLDDMGLALSKSEGRFLSPIAKALEFASKLGTKPAGPGAEPDAASGWRQALSRSADALGEARLPGFLLAPAKTLGRGLVNAAPALMKVLTVGGTAAMFTVGGSILAHGLPFVHIAEGVGLLGTLGTIGAQIAVGAAAGLLVVGAVKGVGALDEKFGWDLKGKAAKAAEALAGPVSRLRKSLSKAPEPAAEPSLASAPAQEAASLASAPAPSKPSVIERYENKLAQKSAAEAAPSLPNFSQAVAEHAADLPQGPASAPAKSGPGPA